MNALHISKGCPPCWPSVSRVNHAMMQSGLRRSLPQQATPHSQWVNLIPDQTVLCKPLEHQKCLLICRRLGH